MKKLPLLFFFLMSLLAALFGSAVLPGVRFLAFSPFLAVSYYRMSGVKALYLAACCGLIVDLLSCQLYFGLHAVNYTLATALLYRQRRHFFEDKTISFLLFTVIISSVISGIHLLFLALSGSSFPINGRFLFTDLIAISFLDGLYGFLWFICPMKLYKYVQKVDWRNLLKKSEKS
jgi:rod shape-determining protein MreD